MVLLMLNPCSIRSCGSPPIEHTMIASDDEYTASGYILQVRLELMYPDGLQYYRPTNEIQTKQNKTKLMKEQTNKAKQNKTK